MKKRPLSYDSVARTSAGTARDRSDCYCEYNTHVNEQTRAVKHERERFVMTFLLCHPITPEGLDWRLGWITKHTIRLVTNKTFPLLVFILW